MSASTQKQALNAMVFLYREVINKPLDGKIAPIRSKHLQRQRCTQNEVQLVLAAIIGKHSLMAKIFYGAGLRLMECIHLRVQEVDF